jgi:hypothetical protein
VARGGADAGLEDERLLEAVAQSYRDRFAVRKRVSGPDLTPPA